MGQTIKYPRAGGRRHLEVRDLLPCHIEGCPDLCCRYLSHDLMHQEDDWWFPPQCGARGLGKTTQEMGGRDLGLPPTGGRYAGGHVGRDEDLHT